MNYDTHTITAKLRRKRLHSALVGRYTCSEMINNILSTTSVYVFIQGRSNFVMKN